MPLGLLGQAAYQASLYQSQAMMGQSGLGAIQQQYKPYGESFKINFIDEPKTFREELQRETDSWLED